MIRGWCFVYAKHGPTLNCTLKPSEVCEVFSMCSLTSNVHRKSFEWRAIDTKTSFHCIWNKRYYILEPFRVTMAPFSNVGEVSWSFIVLKNPKSHKARQFQHTLVDRGNFSIGHQRTFLPFSFVEASGLLYSYISWSFYLLVTGCLFWHRFLRGLVLATGNIIIPEIHNTTNSSLLCMLNP